ncbi:unnamed protein product [Rhizophagus irregularis]|nr:unnamed protein product [Rhizophagus irregularis]
MSKKCYFTSKLLGIGLISPTLHYGIFARDWWETVSLDSKDKDVVFIVLFRLYMRVGCNLNGKDFIITVLQNNKNIYKPGFQCTCENISSKIEPYPSTAINSCYKEVFGTKTEYSGIAVIGFEDEKIIQQLRNEIEFFPIFLRIEKLSVVISGFGYSSKDGYYGAGEDDQCITEIYHNANKIEQFTGLTPDDVWKKVGIYKKFSGSHIFGIIHETTQNLLQSEAVTCKPDEWNNHEKLTKVFDRHIKSQSQIEFWNKAYNDKADRQILENLYNAKLLNIDNKKEDLLWKSFRDAINSNKRGQNGKIRILSIIAPKFKYKDLIQELGVSK